MFDIHRLHRTQSCALRYIKTSLLKNKIKTKTKSLSG